MATTKFESSFTIDVIGETTGDPYRGVFKVRLRLSHRDTLRKDQIRRDLLGTSPEAASNQAILLADVMSELVVRVIEAPSFWTSNGNGLDLPDEAPVAEVYKQTMAAANAATEAIKKAGEAALKDLKSE